MGGNSEWIVNLSQISKKLLVFISQTEKLKIIKKILK